MAELKTKKTDQDVQEFIEAIADERQRRDSRTVLEIMREITNASPRMWGSSIVGFGSYHYKYSSGREGDWFLTGFSPRKQNLTIYIVPGFARYGELTAKLGKFKAGKSCLHVKRLEDINLEALRDLIELSVGHLSRPSS